MSNQFCKIIAHRGASHDAPENTLAAIQLAWRQHADAVEVDVHLSADNHVIVIHDADTRRTTGVNKKVKDELLITLKQLDAGNWKGSQWAGEPLPTLPEVLATVPPQKELVIEIKAGKACLQPIKRDIETSGMDYKRITIIDFDFEVVSAARTILPQCRAVWLLANPASDKKMRDSIQKAARAGLHGLSLDSRISMDQALVDTCRKNNLQCFVWTVNDPGKAEYYQSIGLDGITTDRPGWLKQQLGYENY